MFTTDRDLLILEPNLFRDIGWSAQRLLETTGSTSGTTLTLAAGDAAAVGITAGHVAQVGGIPFEVIQRLSTSQLQVSRLRADDAAPLIPVPTLNNQPVVVSTFAPQLALIHSQVLRMIGIDPGAPFVSGAITESDITNPHSLRLLEALGALHLVFSAAAALSGPDSSLAQRAGSYRDRFAVERHRAAALIDLDGDHLPDAIRRFNVLNLVRA